jgi:hypothetical protein
MAEINSGVIAARQLKKSGTADVGVVAGPMIELSAARGKPQVVAAATGSTAASGLELGWRRRPGVLVVGRPAMTNAITPLTSP